MYTWEIEKLLELKRYILDYDEYSFIINSSPQIKKVKYNPSEDTMETWTKDDDKTNYFKYKVKKRENN